MWEPDWPRRVERRLAEAGFASVRDFVNQRAGVPFADLVQELGETAEVQLCELYLAGMVEAGLLREAVRELLARKIIHRLPAGWGADYELPRALVYADIQLVLRRTEASARVTPRMERVWEALRSMNLEGWLPTGPDDAILAAAFQQGWPEEA